MLQDPLRRPAYSDGSICLTKETLMGAVGRHSGRLNLTSGRPRVSSGERSFCYFHRVTDTVQLNVGSEPCARALSVVSTSYDDQRGTESRQTLRFQRINGAVRHCLGSRSFSQGTVISTRQILKTFCQQGGLQHHGAMTCRNFSPIPTWKGANPVPDSFESFGGWVRTL
jgi:hypothetical protein